MACVPDGLEDVDLLQELPPHALFLDLILVCGLDGYQLASKSMEA